MNNQHDTSKHRKITLDALRTMRADDDKITMLTCYDASFANLMDECGVDVLLVGDSLGMVCQGHTSTLPVTLNDMIYHTASVARGSARALIIADMPFASYASPEATFNHAAQLIQAGAHMVKLEGGSWLAPTITFLTERAIPVCAHLGLTPQSIHQLSGYKVQGKSQQESDQLITNAQILEAAGAAMLVLEAIPAALSKQVTRMLSIPTIGIGAGPETSGQVLVMHDLLGVYPGRKARFVKNFLEGQDNIQAAVHAYITAVKDKTFPATEHCF